MLKRLANADRTAFLATLGEILTFISEGRRLKRRSVAPSLLQPDLVQRGQEGNRRS